MEKCEACDKHPQSVCLIHPANSIDLVIYKLCNNCLLALVNTSLSKKQFKNLIKHGHDPSEFYLHDDFYDEDGTALQPK